MVAKARTTALHGVEVIEVETQVTIETCRLVSFKTLQFAPSRREFDMTARLSHDLKGKGAVVSQKGTYKRHK
jgi:hypothetical protein